MANILGSHSIGHSKKKVYIYICLMGYTESKFTVSSRDIFFDTYFSISNTNFLANFHTYSLLQLRNPLPFVHSVLQLWVHNFSCVKFVIFSSSHFTSCRPMLIFFVLFFQFSMQITLHCQTPFQQNRFCWRFHSSGMCHTFEYLTDFNELKLNLLH